MTANANTSRTGPGIAAMKSPEIATSTAAPTPYAQRSEVIALRASEERVLSSGVAELVTQFHKRLIRDMVICRA